MSAPTWVLPCLCHANTHRSHMLTSFCTCRHVSLHTGAICSQASVLVDMLPHTQLPPGHTYMYALHGAQTCMREHVRVYTHMVPLLGLTPTCMLCMEHKHACESTNVCTNTHGASTGAHTDTNGASTGAHTNTHGASTRAHTNMHALLHACPTCTHPCRPCVHGRCWSSSA